jgi:CubicO group peptidase (beta-lactamase class C family)
MRFPSERHFVAVAVLAGLIVVQTRAQTANTSQENELSSSSADHLVGLWGAELILGPQVRGELTIDARRSQWEATISGYHVPVQQKGDSIRFNLPASAGEFRGHLVPDGQSVAGEWIQPGGIFNRNSYASSVKLHTIETKVWRGMVQPLDDRASFYLSIQRASDGSLTAFIRNPEANWYRRRTYDVTRKEQSIVLSAHGNPASKIQGSYDAADDVLLLSLIDSFPPVRLTRRKDDHAVGFYPRVVANDASYAYQLPLADMDGWPTATLKDVGLDEKPIADLVTRILTTPPSLTNPVAIQSLLIARHGKLVFEKYFYGFDQERPHDMRSASKTFGPLLAGIARDHGAKLGPDTPIYSLFPEYKPFANWDERKDKITLQDLMTMTSGLDCVDSNPNSPGGEDVMQDQTRQPDWYKFFLDLPVLREAGGKDAVYCSSDINLVGGAVRNTTHRWLPDFFDEYVARPLQMHSFYVNLMPTGEAYMGGGLYLRPRDQLKLGQLYLNGGTWNRQRVVSADWVKESLIPRSGFPPVIDVDIDHGYAYAWHTRPLKVGEHIFRDYFAAGNGGQQVIIIPDLDMVIGFTGGDYSEADKYFRWEIQLVPQYIIPAAIQR